MSQDASVSLRVDLNIRGALGKLNKIKSEARGVGRQLNNLGGGRIGGGALSGGRGLVGAVGAGAGLGAGIAVVEQLFEQLFEAFEGTDILENLQTAFKDILGAIAPLAGVLIQAVTPILKELKPLFEALAPALAPILQILGTALAGALQLVVPLLVPVINFLKLLTESLRDGLLFVLNKIVGWLNRIPGVNIRLPDLSGSFATAQSQLAAAQAGAPGAAAKPVAMIENKVIVEDEVVQRTVQRAEVRYVQLGGSLGYR